MTRSALYRAAACAAALVAVAIVSPAARAQPQPEGPGFTFGVYSTGSFVPNDPELPVITGFGTTTPLSDGSRISHMGCIASSPGGIGCSTSGLPIVVDTWYKRPDLPTNAAAQSYAEFGLLKARSWRTLGETGDGAPGDPLGSRSYYAEASAEWREDLIYTGSAPTQVTMQFTLHTAWNDLGRFAFTVGRDTIGAENVRLIDGLSYVNCAGPVECGSGNGSFGAQPVQVLGDDAANTNGDVTLAIDYSFLLYPQIPDPEDPNSTDPFNFVAHLFASGGQPGAEVDAFHTATLDRILIEPGAQITFASGTSWPVQVVPEPGTVLLWLAGLAALVPVVRRRPTAG